MLFGQTAKPNIFEAAAAGDLPRATELANADPEAVRLKSSDGRTALHFATAAGKTEMVTFLMSRGADLSAGPESPLLAAVDYPDRETATSMSRTLLGNASDPNARRRDGKTALQLAAARGYGDLTEMLIHRGARVTPGDLEIAAGDAAAVLQRASQIEMVHFDRRPPGQADVNGVPWTTITQFVTVAHFDFDKVKELLTDHPAMVNARSSWDELAIEAAAHMGLFPMAEWLAGKGAPISTCTAVLLGLAGRVNEALAADRKCVYERGAHDIPILAYTVYGKEQAEIADALLQAGANVRAAALGTTVLHVAASKGYVDAAGVLIEHGADVNATTKSRGEMLTPLAVAMRAKQSKMEELLKQRGGRL
jgi:ankyrin repeat protein